MSRATLHELGEVLFPSATVRLVPSADFPSGQLGGHSPGLTFRWVC